MENACLGALRHLSLVLALWLGPLVAYAACGSRAPRAARTSLACGYALLVVVLVSLRAYVAFAFVAGGVAYYVAAACAANWLRDRFADGGISRGGLLVVLAFVFLFLPGMALPGIAVSLFLVLGWKLMLSAYSYCLDTGRGRLPRAASGELFFFLFVSPCLVYSRRGLRDEARCALAPGFGRALLGTCILLAASLGSHGVAAFERRVRAGGPSTFALLLVALVYVLLFYAAHSGLAHVQIGLMRAIGWIVPERYDYPLFAKDLADFWRRWNTYVRDWLEAYVLAPTGMALARRSRAGWVPAAAGGATLVASGLIHDVFNLAGEQVFTLRYTEFFFVATIAWIAWRLIERLARRLALFRANGPSSRWLARGGAAVSRVALAGLLAAAALHLR
jgi:hypothetical protein